MTYLVLYCQVDVFTFEAVTLKKLSKIRIGHDGKNAGAGWFLDKVVIKQDGTDKFNQVFECNRWLAIDEDDGLIIREITAGKITLFNTYMLFHEFSRGFEHNHWWVIIGGSQLLSTTSYNVTVKTGDVSGAGTDANCYIKVHH